MIAEILTLVAFLVENCMGVTLIETCGSRNTRSSELQETLLPGEEGNQENQDDNHDYLDDFTKFDPNDTIFREFDPPKLEERDPKSWKKSLPSFKKTLWMCLKNVLLIQTISGTLIGFLAVVIVFLDFSTAEWCFDKTLNWNRMPKSVQNLRVTAQSIEGFIIEMWDFTCIIAIFPLSLIKDLHLLTLNLLAGFIDVAYRLYFQIYEIYKISWMSFPLNVLFSLTIIINNYLLARYFHPNSLINTLKTDFILSAQFVLGLPAALIVVYKIVPLYIEQDEEIKVLIAAFSPLVSALPKVVSRLGAQTLKEIIHPGTAHVLVAGLYGASAITFRVMQAELSSLSLFVALGIAHAIVDLVERITITMRDHIWEYFYRLLRGQRTEAPKYRSPRSRRFIADVSIQIMLQESTALIGALGFINVYHFMYSEPPFSDYKYISNFFGRAAIGLLIDLFFNTLSLLIQIRVMNVAVNKVWKKKWRSHIVVNALMICISVVYFSEYLFGVVRSKYDYSKHPKVRYQWNCTYPSFL